MKTNIGYILLAVFFILPSLSLAGEIPSLLWKKKFDSQIVKIIWLKELETPSKKNAEFPVKTVMTPKSIFVLDSKGKIKNKISLNAYDKVAMSDNGMSMAVMKGKEITISTIDNQIQGKFLIGDSKSFFLPQHISFELSPDGNYIVIISWFTNTIYFYNNNGEMLSQHNFEDVRKSEVRFSKDSRYAAIHVPNWGEGKTSGYLLFFNSKGEKLWKIDHKGCQAEFDISADGGRVVLAAEDRLYSLDKRGKVVYEKEIKPGRVIVRISGNGKYVCLTGNSDHVITLLDNQNGDVVWSENISGFDSINSPITDLSVSEQGERVLVSISKDWSRRNKESSLFLFDNSGKLLWNPVFETGRIQTSLSDDGGSVLITGNREAFFYRLKN